MNLVSSPLFLRRTLSSLSALGALFALGLAARAQDTHVVLDRYVVSASRSPQAPQFVSSSVSVLSLTDLASAQITDLRSALAAEPGVIVVNTGAVGGQSAVFLRGASSHQTLLIVDGVRMSDRAAAYNNFLGGSDLGGIDRVEVLRGPQSTLYGSSAMGGVILLDTSHGCAPFSGQTAVSAGSFDTFGAAVSAQGGTKMIGYSASVSRQETANEQPANDFRVWSYSTRIEAAPSAALLIGATFRGQNGELQDVGSRFFPAAALVGNDNYLGTAYLQARSGESFISRLTFAQHRREYTYTTFGSFGFSSALENRRNIVDWQNTWLPRRGVEVVGGVNLERSRYVIDGAESKDDVRAAYVSATLKPSATVVITGGVRHDHFDSVGGATTWRSGLAWLPVAGTKLRATYGTGFSAPGTDDRYGVPQWGQLPNPDLKPEKSRGWDVGVDQEIAAGRAALAVTYFQNRYHDLFEWEYVNPVTFEGRIVNRARASTEGVEVATTVRVTTAVKTRLAYTYLEARDDELNTRLIRRPRHTADAEIQFQPVKAWMIGGGIHVVSDRVSGLAAIEEDYTTVRVFSSYALREDLLLKLRLENAADEHYEEVSGYPALSRAAYGSVEWHF